MSEINNSSDDQPAKLLSKELFNHCKSYSLSEEGIRKIIRCHGLTQHSNYHVDDYEFFLVACKNERVTEGIIRCLIECFPDAASATNNNGWTPLHRACCNKNMTLKLIQLIINGYPDSIRRVTNQGSTPLHILCRNSEMDGMAAIEILKFLLEKCPESVRLAKNGGLLPIHIAVSELRSPEFCRVLIEAYPGSERITTIKGELPLHGACYNNSLATVEYLHRLSTDTIGVASTASGHYPIHAAILGMQRRENPAAAVEIVKFLLDCNSNVKLQKHKGRSLLQFACGQPYNDANIEAGIKMITVIFDARPASTDGFSPLHYACSNISVKLNIIQRLIEEAPESIRSVDNNGRMPLHILCKRKKNDDAAATEILTLLIEKYPEAVRHANNTGSLPLHLAAVNKSPEFCRVLIEAYPGSERISTNNGSLPLHQACATNSFSSVEYLYRQYPEAIDRTTTTRGLYPIHYAMQRRENTATAVEIVQFLLDCDPNQKLIQYEGASLLHFACGQHYYDSNIEAGIQMINVIFSAHPASVRSVNAEGNIPLHSLCERKVDEAAAIQILKVLLEKHLEAAQHVNNNGYLPIHIAAGTKSPDFCRVLIEAYPGSEQITDNDYHALPLHYACGNNSLATVEYLYNLYPDAITTPATPGYPIHFAIAGKTYRDGTAGVAQFLRGMTERDNPAAAVEVVQFLLDCDPDQKLIQFEEESLLHYACKRRYNDSSIEAGVQMIKIVYDAHPEAIEERIVDDRTMRSIQRSRQRIQAFINSQLAYARQANDHRLMMTPDDNGQLPLHTALQNNVRLGSIKLLIKGNPSAIRNIDDNGALPLHVACEHHESASVAEFILSLARITHDALDREGNTALHLACRGAKYETIALLLENYGAASVSKRNTNGKLPIDMLWESNAVEDRESIEYTGSVFQLLRAYPEMVQSAMR